MSRMKTSPRRVVMEFEHPRWNTCTGYAKLACGHRVATSTRKGKAPATASCWVCRAVSEGKKVFNVFEDADILVASQVIAMSAEEAVALVRRDYCIDATTPMHATELP